MSDIITNQVSQAFQTIRFVNIVRHPTAHGFLGSTENSLKNNLSVFHHKINASFVLIFEGKLLSDETIILSFLDVMMNELLNTSESVCRI